MWDILTFRKMVTPSLLQFLFWVAMVIFIITAIINLSHHHALAALFWLIIAPLVLRVIVELMMCFFVINNQLNEIRHSLNQEKSMEDKD